MGACQLKSKNFSALHRQTLLRNPISAFQVVTLLLTNYKSDLRRYDGFIASTDQAISQVKNYKGGSLNIWTSLDSAIDPGLKLEEPHQTHSQTMTADPHGSSFKYKTPDCCNCASRSRKLLPTHKIILSPDY
ncbi:hypothetical protein FGO68_gene10255 [Halteria grandinella]|uniref:Uncharacterized protein n=1 Tax=Halteria grandinella TaxID=5974 RepID=A0A8J8NT21_HALGN|nr:hypothetical protein FGO68_gene10255 [Halteria grandinella]